MSEAAQLLGSGGISFELEKGKESDRLIASIDGQRIGQLDYTLRLDGTVYVDWIEVYQKWRNQGIGAKMMREIQNLFPAYRLAYGGATHLGAGMLRSMGMSEAAKLLSMVENDMSPLEARSKEEFNNLVRTMDQNERNQLLKYIEEINLQGYAQRLGTQNPVLLYHGSPQEAIAKEGLKLGKGRRSSMVLPGLASEYEVDNLGIFMTDDIGMAHYFGSNRSKYGGDYKVYQAYANLDHMVDLSAGKFPRGLVKLGTQLLSQHYGQPKKNIAQSEVFWLLDQPEFVNAIKQLGFTSVRFKEAQSTRKEASQKAYTSTGTTIMILDPRLLLVKGQQNDTLKTLDDLWNHIQRQRGAAVAR